MATVYEDSRGRVVRITSVTAGTFRKAKAAGFTWLNDPAELFQRIADPVDLADLLSMLTGESIEDIDAGLSGDAVERAQDAIIGAIAAFYPSRGGESLRRALTMARKAQVEAMAEAEAAMERESSKHVASSPESSA